MKKRLKKKQRKKQLQRQIVTVRPDIEKVNRLSQSDLETIISQEQQREQKKQERRKRLLQNRAKKVQALAERGIDPFSIPVKQIDKIKLKDLDSLDRHKYPFLFSSAGFDFNRVYKLKDGQRMYLAYRDFAGETSLEEILSQYAHLSNEQLLDRLEEQAHTRPTYNRKTKSGSSGSAGDYRMTWARQNVISDFQSETYSRNRKQKKHNGTYKGYQVLKDGRRNSFDEVTPRSMLIIMNAFMSNITENDRMTFYNDMYLRIRHHMPDFAALLPKPL